MAGVLKVVATPIGNINDISARAISALKSAKVIMAEDTRHSLKLIQALGIELSDSTKLISCHSQMERKRISVVIERLSANDDVVVISDAGCPTISDPGSRLIEAVIEAGFKIEVIPGPSAITSALMGAGLDTNRFAFLGFLPESTKERQSLIMGAARAGLAIVIFESPLRVSDLLNELFVLLGARRVVIARELTKIYETFHRGHLGSSLNPPITTKGECVVVVEGGHLINEEFNDNKENVLDFIAKELKGSAQKTKEVAVLVAKKFNMKKSAAYELVIKTIGDKGSFPPTD